MYQVKNPALFSVRDILGGYSLDSRSISGETAEYMINPGPLIASVHLVETNREF
jgi:hypothetical protein